MASDNSSNTIAMDVNDPVALQRERNDSHTMDPIENNSSKAVFVDLTGRSSQPSSRSQTVGADSTSGAMESDTKPADSATNLTVLDPQGELFLTVKFGPDDNSKVFQGSDSCTSLADETWNDAANKYTWEVDHEDHAYVLELAFRAAHLEYDMIPQVLPWKTIVHIAEVEQRYSGVKPLRPYLDGWVMPYVDKLLQPGYEMWLLVAYKFGYVDLFPHVLEHTALNMRPVESHDSETDEGMRSYAMPSGVKISESTIGKELFDALIHIRSGFITSIITSAHACIDKLLTSADDSPVCSQQCHAMVLGSLMQNLKALNLWPQKTSPANITTSALELFANLHGMKIHAAKEHYSLDLFCSIEHVDTLKHANADWPHCSVVSFPRRHELINTVFDAVAMNSHPNSTSFSSSYTFPLTSLPPPTLLWKQSAIYNMGFRASDFLSEEEADDSGEGWIEENEMGEEVMVWADSYTSEDAEEDEEEEEPDEEYEEDTDSETQSEEEKGGVDDEDVEMGGGE